MASYVGFLADLTQTIQVIGPPVCREVGLLTNLQHNMNILVEEAESLKRKRENLEADGEEASRKRQKLTNHLDSCWLQKAEDSIKEIESMKSEFQNSEAMSNWNCAKYLSRYWLGRRVIKMIKTVKDLHERGIFSSPRVSEMPISISTHGQSTAEQTLKEIWDRVHDKNSHIIGLCGIGGVGKTACMKITNNRLIDTQDFDIVIWITVGVEFILKKIHMEIMERLGLNFDENDDEERSAQVLAALKSKRFLLILDDLWQAIELDQVGIPKPDRQNRSKIVISTRQVDVCDKMKADAIIRVNGLNKVEAWNLFLDKVGEVALRPEIEHLAKEVAMECNGLPLAINVLGATLRGHTNIELWQNTLRKLKEPTEDIRSMMPEVYPALKLSYDLLKDQIIKNCFLFCCLFPENYEIKIEELVMFWVAEGFIDDSAYDKGYRILDRLMDACMLEGGQKGDRRFVKMNSVVRDMAIGITLSYPCSPRFMVRAGVGLTEPPQEDMWRENERISLMRNKISSLLFVPDCPNHLSLMVGENPSLTTIHECFFARMANLTTLDLGSTGIESLPMSIKCLYNLHFLSLRKCKQMREVELLVEIKTLKFLDLSHSGVQSLPQGMKNLVLLRALNLSHMKKLSTIPYNVITALSYLEELRLFGTFINWAKESQMEDERAATLAEVASLRRLRTLKITISDIDCVAQDVFHQQWSTLNKFKISVGPNSSSEISLPCAKQVHISGSGRCSDGVKAMLTHAEGVFLNGSDIKCFSHLVENSKSLRMIRIEACHEMESVINWRDVGDGALKNIEELRLYEIPALKKIFEGEAPQNLHKLRRIVVHQCNSLKYLFSSEMVQYLDYLELLYLTDCEDLEEIIEGDESLPVNPLSGLRSLILFKLRKLRSIVRFSSVSLPSLTEFLEDFCPRLMLPNCPSITRIQESANAGPRAPRPPHRYR